MRRILTSIRFQLVFVLLVFILVTFFTISSNVTEFLRQNEIASEAKRLSVVAKQIRDRFEKMYTAEALLRRYDFIPASQKELNINIFLKPAFDNYFGAVSTAYPDVEAGYYIPIFKDPIKTSSSQNNLVKKIIVVESIPSQFGGGYIFTAIPYSTFEESISHTIQSINRIVFYLAITTLSITLLITSFFSLRILQIRRGLKNLEKNLDFRFPNYGGEIGDIAVSINSMAENLRRNLEEMKRAEALQTLGLFTTGIVHEVRNPLTSIKGFASILSQKLQGKDEERFVTPILTETERLQHIVDDLLKYGRPSPLSLSSFNLKPFFAHIIELVKQYDSNKKVEFILDCPDTTIVADERKFEEMFLNLLINAIQAIESSGVIKIKCSGDKMFHRFEVQDNGVGMDKETLDKIFVPFFTTKDRGTGLGLAIVHRIVEEHGGEIFVESERGRGTTFRVVIPKRELK